MPPKAVEAASDNKDTTIHALCNIILQQENHKIDTNALAAVFGLSHGKNVPRKLNVLLNPYGLKCEHGKLVKTDDTTPNTIVNTSAPANTDDNTKNNQDPIDEHSVMVPLTPKTPKTTKARKPATKASAKGKKRASPAADEGSDDNEAAAVKPTPKKAKTPAKASKAKAVKAKPEPETEEDEVKDEAAISDTEG